MSESLRSALEKLDEAIDLLEEIAGQAMTTSRANTNVIHMPQADTAAALDDMILSVRKILSGADAVAA